MKLKFRDKLLLFLCSLIVLAVGAGLIVLGFQFSSVTLSAKNEGFFTWPRMLVMAAGLLAVLVSVYLFTLPRKLRYDKRSFVVQQTDNGELRIAIKAIENLVQKCIDMHEEIHVVSMQIANGREGVTIDLCISLANNISIPLAVASLQKQIKQYLAVSSGIDVREVRVSVETADDGGVGESPYLVESQMPVRQESAKPQKDKKKTLHQRVFEREDEPAIVPAAPVVENPQGGENERLTEELFAETESETVSSADSPVQANAEHAPAADPAAQPLMTEETIPQAEGETK